jgi:hypothetical protein
VRADCLTAGGAGGFAHSPVAAGGGADAPQDVGDHADRHHKLVGNGEGEQSDQDENQPADRSAASEISVDQMGISNLADHQQPRAEHDHGQGDDAGGGQSAEQALKPGRPAGRLDLVNEPLLEQNPRGDRAAGGGAGQSQKAEVMLLTVFVADVEPRQPQGGAAHEQRADPKAEPGQDERDFFGIAGVAEHQKQQGEKRRCGAEADDIGEAVELTAEIGGVPGKAGEPAVECVEHHRQENEVCPEAEFVMHGNIHRAKPADGVTQRRHAGEEIDRTDIGPAPAPPKPQPAAFANLQAILARSPVLLRAARVGTGAHAGVSRPISGSSSGFAAGCAVV